MASSSPSIFIPRASLVLFLQKQHQQDKQNKQQLNPSGNDIESQQLNRVVEQQSNSDTLIVSDIVEVCDDNPPNSNLSSSSPVRDDIAHTSSERADERCVEIVPASNRVTTAVIANTPTPTNSSSPAIAISAKEGDIQLRQFNGMIDKWIIDIAHSYCTSFAPPLKYFPSPFRSWDKLITLLPMPETTLFVAELTSAVVGARFRTLRHRWIHKKLAPNIAEYLGTKSINVFATNPNRIGRLPPSKDNSNQQQPSAVKKRPRQDEDEAEHHPPTSKRLYQPHDDSLLSDKLQMLIDMQNKLNAHQKKLENVEFLISLVQEQEVLKFAVNLSNNSYLAVANAIGMLKSEKMDLTAQIDLLSVQVSRLSNLIEANMDAVPK